ncbi:flagellin [Oceanospirillum maris]|uniref:flagellin N-terminal helical domain-containing protein n=1 Tax=Oceanospirillum maris TaxID=64977 RepID=UPI00040C1FC8|nr:flagellin [Oceanospirillum maris]
MALFVNTNVAALNGQKNLMDVTSRMNSSFEKLSSGSRINSAKDDAAGLQISDRLTTQVIGLEQATRNANDGISIAQIAEGALSEVTTNIQRMRQLVVQGGNRTLSSDDRNALGQEFTKLLDVNNDIAGRTSYGTQKLLNSDSPEAGFQIQTGAYSGEQDTITTGNAELSAMFGKVLSDEGITGDLSDMSAGLSDYGTLGEMVGAYMAVNGESDIAAAADALLGVRTGDIAASSLGERGAAELNVVELTKVLTQEASGSGGFAVLSTVSAALGFMGLAGTGSDVLTGDELHTIHGFATDTLLDSMTSLITQVDKQRAKLGAEQNGLTSVIRSNTTAVVNVSDSRSRIMDTDFAAETSELTRNQIIQQASTTILSQANQLPQTALTLLG